MRVCAQCGEPVTPPYTGCLRGTPGCWRCAYGYVCHACGYDEPAGGPCVPERRSPLAPFRRLEKGHPHCFCTEDIREFSIKCCGCEAYRNTWPPAPHGDLERQPA